MSSRSLMIPLAASGAVAVALTTAVWVQRNMKSVRSAKAREEMPGDLPPTLAAYPRQALEEADATTLAGNVGPQIDTDGLDAVEPETLDPDAGNTKSFARLRRQLAVPRTLFDLRRDTDDDELV